MDAKELATPATGAGTVQPETRFAGKARMKIAVDDPIKEAETLLGQAALRVWGNLPRDGQEMLFESAVGDDDHMRKLLAVFLHDRHPKTYHPPKPDTKTGSKV